MGFGSQTFCDSREEHTGDFRHTLGRMEGRVECGGGENEIH